MANGRFILGKQSGGTLGLVFPDGISNTEVMLPESGNLVSVNTAVTDNAIARYDGTTGKLQDSGVYIDDNNNLRMLSPTGNGCKLSIWAADAQTYGSWGLSTINGRSLSITDDYGAVERMRVNASGNVGIGTTIDNGVDKLQVNGSIVSKSSYYKYSDLNNACTANETTIVSNTCLNVPYNDFGYVSIIVSVPNSYCMQTFIGLNDPVRLLIRILVNGVWTAWVEK